MTQTVRDPEDMLAAIDLFSGLSRREARRLVSAGRQVTHVAGKQVAGEGDMAYAFHLVLSGSATVTHGGVTLRRIGPGDYFGEISMIDGRPRSATVTVDEDMRALAIDHGVFSSLLDDQPEFARGLLLGLCSRLREAEARAEPPS
jgi:CRP-like cAMP-binding protein